tara:strand:- start:2215 stop:2853 length:639 start_codon:yes stop_codon:yes gene_type:complete
MKSSRSRSRSKNNRNRPQQGGGNVVNRVFDSSGPEGKVRGTPQQVIEKYNQLARDAQLSNDRVAAENFQQHAEHYLRMLSEAQREIDQRREEQERQNRERQAERDRERAERQERDGNQGGQNNTQNADPQPSVDTDQPDVAKPPQKKPKAQDATDLPDFVTGSSTDDDSGLVETPESKPKPKRAPRRKPKPKADPAPDTGGDDQPDAPEAAE